MGRFKRINGNDFKDAAEYYVAVLARAGVGFKPIAQPQSSDPRRLGTITANDLDEAVLTISEAEAGETFRWDPASDNSPDAPLQNMRRANVAELDWLFKSQPWTSKCNAQPCSNARDLPDYPGDYRPFKLIPESGKNFAVTADPNALALYVPVDPDGPPIVYQTKEGGTLVPVWVWLSEGKSASGWERETAALHLERSFESSRRGSRSGDKPQQNLSAEQNWCYVYHLWLLLLERHYDQMKAAGLDIFRAIFPQQTPAVALEKLKQCGAEADPKDADRMDVAQVEGDSPPGIDWKELEGLAVARAKSPQSDQLCYYFEHNHELCTYIDDPPDPETGGAFGGYESRAETPDQYQWCLFPAGNTRDDAWATLIAMLLDLPEEKKCLIPGWLKRWTPSSFWPTEWPAPAFARADEPSCSVRPPIHYFRPTSTVASEKTSPSFLKWKKGASLEGESFKSYKGRRRKNAGAVMAKALGAFDFYSELGAAVTGTCLPATKLARHVFAEDPDARSWHDQRSDVAPDFPGKQEWCHLFGHGEGGREVLENLVSASFHCNTEQLAIETGQRRITRNASVPEGVKQKLTWKVTAHLVPNRGTSRKQRPQTAFSRWCEESGERPNRAHLEDLKAAIEALDPRADPTKVLKTVSDLLKDRAVRLKQEEDDDARDWLGKESVALNAFRNWYQRESFMYFPIAAKIHYRVFYDRKKCFEHRFDGQSRGFDLNQARLLDYTVERAIYEAMDADSDASIAWPDETPWDLYCDSLRRRIEAHVEKPPASELDSLFQTLRAEAPPPVTSSSPLQVRGKRPREMEPGMPPKYKKFKKE
jgi:hypothetical protein